MSDLVERLLAAVVETDDQDRLLREAANRMEALETEVEALKSEIGDALDWLRDTGDAVRGAMMLERALTEHNK
jgi:hypothetical protein